MSLYFVVRLVVSFLGCSTSQTSFARTRFPQLSNLVCLCRPISENERYTVGRINVLNCDYVSFPYQRKFRYFTKVPPPIDPRGYCRPNRRIAWCMLIEKKFAADTIISSMPVSWISLGLLLNVKGLYQLLLQPSGSHSRIHRQWS